MRFRVGPVAVGVPLTAASAGLLVGSDIPVGQDSTSLNVVVAAVVKKTDVDLVTSGCDSIPAARPRMSGMK
jgi:hypothetical protein